MKKKIFRKLHKNNRGFSIAETLAAVLILLMVSSVVATGLPVAARAYTKVMDSSNAQLLLSTTISNLREELADASVGASPVTATSGVYSIAYVNTVSGASTISFKEDGVYINTPNITYTVGTETKTERKLVSDKASAGLVFKVETVSYADGVIKLENITVVKSGQTNALSSLPELDIKVLGN